MEPDGGAGDAKGSSILPIKGLGRPSQVKLPPNSRVARWARGGTQKREASFPSKCWNGPVKLNFPPINGKPDWGVAYPKGCGEWGRGSSPPLSPLFRLPFPSPAPFRPFPLPSVSAPFRSFPLPFVPAFPCSFLRPLD